MVDPNYFSRIRIVRDKSMESDDELSREQQGTKVFEDVLKADQGSLFPLQGALGYDIAQTLLLDRTASLWRVSPICFTCQPLLAYCLDSNELAFRMLGLSLPSVDQIR